MTELTTKTLIITALTTFLIACSAPTPTASEKDSEEFELGTTHAGHYHNRYFDLDIYFDSTWSVQKKEQIEFMKNIGKKVVVGENENMKAFFDAAMVNTAYLLTIFKHPLGARVDYNPSFISLVENVSVFAGIKTGEDYLFHVQKLLGKTPLEYQFEEVYERRVGTKLFHVLELKADYMGEKIQQSYWCTITKGFCVSFILSYHSEKEQEELMEIINKVKI